MCRKEGGSRQERKREERMREYIFKSVIHFMHHTALYARCNATTNFFPLSPFVSSFSGLFPPMQFLHTIMESFFAPHLYFLESLTSLEEVCEMSEGDKRLSKGGRNKLVQDSK